MTGSGEWFATKYFWIGWFIGTRLILLLLVFLFPPALIGSLTLQSANLEPHLLKDVLGQFDGFITFLSLGPVILFTDHLAKRYAKNELQLSIHQFVGWSIAWRWGLWSALINIAGLFGLALLGVSFGVAKSSSSWVGILAVIIVLIWVFPVSFYALLQTGGLAFTRVIDRLKTPGVSSPKMLSPD